VRIVSMALAALFFAQASGACADPVVRKASGPIVGAEKDGVAAFKGVPFAQPPIGPLRWRAPQAPSRWTEPRPAKAYGSDCIEAPSPGDAAPLGGAVSEDCLYLNVWAPAKAVGATARLPVMVWIHGGGFVNGGSSPAVFSGDRFARDGVVLVSLNYRLGRFGYFAHPALSAENADGGKLANYGLLDQIAALRWVQDNIARFGGDPDNVTLFGESAGGISVQVLLRRSPRGFSARRSFNRAAVVPASSQTFRFARPTARGPRKASGWPSRRALVSTAKAPAPWPHCAPCPRTRSSTA